MKQVQDHMETASFGFTTLAVVAAGVGVWMAAPLPSWAAAPETPAFRSTYDKPPQNILEVLHAPAPAVPVLSPARDKAILGHLGRISFHHPRG